MTELQIITSMAFAIRGLLEMVEELYTGDPEQDVRVRQAKLALTTGEVRKHIKPMPKVKSNGGAASTSRLKGERDGSVQSRLRSGGHHRNWAAVDKRKARRKLS